MESVDAEDFAKYHRRASRPARLESASTGSSSQSIRTELSALQDKFSQFEVQTRESPRIENISYSGQARTETHVGKKDSRSTENSDSGPRGYLFAKGALVASGWAESQSKKSKRSENEETFSSSNAVPVPVPDGPILQQEADLPSPIDSFDDELSDDEDLTKHKIAYHRAERDKLTLAGGGDISVLKVHLIAMVEQFKVQDNILRLHLAALYETEKQYPKILPILKDFKFDSDLTPAENAMTYLIRASAYSRVSDFPAATKDCRRVSQVAKKYSDYSNMICFANAANLQAIVCAHGAKNKADELYYTSLYNSKITIPSIEFGLDTFSWNAISDYRLTGLELPANTKYSGSKANPVLKQTKKPAPAQTLPKAVTPNSSAEPLTCTMSNSYGGITSRLSPFVFFEDYDPFGREDKKYLMDEFAIAISFVAETNIPLDFHGSCIEFKSQAQILDVFLDCIKSRRLQLANKILLGSHRGSDDAVFGIGFGYEIQYPSGAPYRPFRQVETVVQFLALIQPSETDLRDEFTVRCLIDGIREVQNQYWKDSPRHSRDQEITDAFFLALSVQNPLFAYRVSPWMGINGSKNDAHKQPGKSSNNLEITSAALIVVLESQQKFVSPLLKVLKITKPSIEFFKDKDLFNCFAKKLNLFHIAAKYTTNSLEPLQYLLKIHTCKTPINYEALNYGNLFTHCYKRAEKVEGFDVKVTPYEIILIRAMETTDDAILNVLRSMAQALSAVGANCVYGLPRSRTASRRNIPADTITPAPHPLIAKGFPSWRLL